MLRFVFNVLAFLSVAITSAHAAPASWIVDPAKSSLTFAVVVNGQNVTGTFPGFGALISFAADDLTHSSAKITMDMTGVNSGDSTRDATLRQPDWFNVLDFPQAVFQTTSIVSNGGNNYVANGTLKMKGVAKPVVLPFSLDIKGDVAAMKGATILKRLEFGVGTGSNFATAKPVALDVKVMVNITAKRAK